MEFMRSIWTKLFVILIPEGDMEKISDKLCATCLRLPRVWHPDRRLVRPVNRAVHRTRNQTAVTTSFAPVRSSHSCLRVRATRKMTASQLGQRITVPMPWA